MARSRFVKPDTDTLPLSEGDVIIVKRRLNHGETVESRARMFPRGEDGTVRTDPARYRTQLVLAYLVDWNLTDDGRPVPMRGLPDEERAATLNALDDDDFLEIVTAIEQHIEAKAAERAQEKKLPDGATASPPTSPSVGS
jgi:hypothetical protein